MHVPPTAIEVYAIEASILAFDRSGGIVSSHSKEIPCGRVGHGDRFLGVFKCRYTRLDPLQNRLQLPAVCLLEQPGITNH